MQRVTCEIYVNNGLVAVEQQHYPTIDFIDFYNYMVRDNPDDVIEMRRTTTEILRSTNDRD